MIKFWPVVNQYFLHVGHKLDADGIANARLLLSNLSVCKAVTVEKSCSNKNTGSHGGKQVYRKTLECVKTLL